MALSLRNAVRSLAINTVLVRERMQSGLAFNPMSARLAQDPYPIFARLRERDPVHRSLLMDAWVFSRHADVDAILRDHRRFASDPRKRERARQRQARMRPEDCSLLFLDPPDHTRLRNLVNKAFTRRAVTGLEPHIRAHVTALLDAVDGPAGFDHGGGRHAAAGDRHRRDAGRPAGGPRPFQDLVRPGTPACWNRRSARRSGKSGRRPRRHSTSISSPSSNGGAPTRGTTSSAPSRRRKRQATA